MYIDPGFGGMLLQALVAIVAVSGAIVFSFRRKIKMFFSKDKASKNTSRPASNYNQAEGAADDVIDTLSADE